MTECCDLKPDQVLVCELCGLELKVMTRCSCASEDSGACSECSFICCGQPMKLK